MKITVESTTKTVTVNGVQARIWEGQTDSGIPVHCYVTRVAVHEGQDCAQFEKELRECRQPSADVQAIPMRLVL